jgi:hypothetical protein
MVNNPKALPDRFWEKVLKRGDDECWIFTGTKNNKGYGMLQQQIDGQNGKRLAHRISYELHFGWVPKNQCVLHRCDNPPCVNPAHLFLGTKSDNSYDMHRKGRWHMDPAKRSRPPHHVGAAHPKAKLNEALVVQYRLELASGKPLRQLARETGLGRKTLMHMRDRVTWRHVA